MKYKTKIILLLAGILSLITITTAISAYGWDETQIAVMSDIHYYDPSLGTTGSAFKEEADGRKLHSQSAAIDETAMNSVIKSKARIILISGDLTKDGEKINHEKVAKLLKKVEESGKKVYVINGNHDINNPEAMKYEGDHTIKVDSISPEDFKTIYADYGYNEAIAKDPDSLSYVVQPTKKLRIIAIDDCKYEPDSDRASGELSAAKLAWIKAQIDDAKKKDITIIGMMHHGLVEHYGAQDDIAGAYLLDDWENMSKTLADCGLQIMFTGHYHAMDISSITSDNNNTLYDVETGSLISYPCSYRIASLTNNEITFKTMPVELNLDGKTLQEYAKPSLISYLDETFPEIFVRKLMRSGLSEEESLAITKNLIAQKVSPSMTVMQLVEKAGMGNYNGDEKLSQDVKDACDKLMSSDSQYAQLNQLIGKIVLSLSIDETPDNNTTLIIK